MLKLSLLHVEVSSCLIVECGSSEIIIIFHCRKSRQTASFFTNLWTKFFGKLLLDKKMFSMTKKTVFLTMLTGTQPNLLIRIIMMEPLNVPGMKFFVGLTFHSSGKSSFLLDDQKKKLFQPGERLLKRQGPPFAYNHLYELLGCNTLKLCFNHPVARYRHNLCSTKYQIALERRGVLVRNDLFALCRCMNFITLRNKLMVYLSALASLNFIIRETQRYGSIYKC